MTSRSRRKLQTTQPNSPTANSTAHGSDRPLRACLLLAVAVAIAMASANPARAELQWQHGRNATQRSLRSEAALKFSKPETSVRVASRALATSTSASFTTSSGTEYIEAQFADSEPLRHSSEARIASHFADSASSESGAPSVRLASFEDDGGVELTAGEGRASVRSIVVDGEPQFEPVRSAQLPSGAAQPSPAPGAAPVENDVLEQELRSPFLEDLPPFEEPDTESFQMPAMPPGAEPQVAPGQLPDRGTIEPAPVPRSAPLDLLPSQQLPDRVPSPDQNTIEAERRKSEAACADGMDDLREKTIDKLSLSISVTGDEGTDYPFECTLDETWHTGRTWEQTTYLWKASALCHKPLYFEDEQLERYGHSFSPCFQPFISGAHFFTRLPVLPYCMGVEPPCECVYALGHYRPGSCAPYMINPIPLSPRGALLQGGATVGVSAILP